MDDIEKLLADIDSLDLSVRNSAAEEIRKGDTNLVHGLKSILKNTTQPSVRSKASLALSMIRNTEALSALLELLDNEERLTKLAAVRAVIGYKQPEIETKLLYLLESNKTDVILAQEILKSLRHIASSNAFEVIKQFINDTELRCAAIQVIGNIGDSRIVPQLIELAESDICLEEVIGALQAIQDPRAVPVFIEMLKSKTGEVWTVAVGGLEDLLDVALPQLIDALYRTTDEAYYQQILWFLRNFADHKIILDLKAVKERTENQNLKEMIDITISDLGEL